MAEQQIIYPVDDWIRATQTDGTIHEVRFDFLVVGWSGGNIMEKDEGVIKFAGLPKELTKATLTVSPTEYLLVQPGDEAIIRVGGQEVGRDRQAQPTPVSLDITPMVKGKGGELLVELSPTAVSGVRNWLRKYGSVRHAAAEARSRILIEGAPVVNPPPGEQPPVSVAPGIDTATQALGSLLPLLALGMMAGAMGEATKEMGLAT